MSSNKKKDKDGEDVTHVCRNKRAFHPNTRWATG
jgi:hypothetical protein